MDVVVVKGTKIIGSGSTVADLINRLAELQLADLEIKIQNAMAGEGWVLSNQPELSCNQAVVDRLIADGLFVLPEDTPGG